MNSNKFTFKYFKNGIYKYLKLFYILLIHCLYFIPSIILNLCNIKFINLYYQAIGHLLLDADTHVKKKKLKLIPNYTSILVISDTIVANKYAVKYLKSYFVVFENKYVVKILKPFLDSKIVGLNIENYTAAINKTAEIFEINTIWKNKGMAPLFNLLHSDVKRGENALQMLGISKNNWFVCLHVHSSGFSIMEEAHTYRNSPFDTYIKAIEFIISMGGYVFVWVILVCQLHLKLMG